MSSVGSYYYTHGGSKLNTLVEFPLESLDLSKYVLGKEGDSDKFVYDLISVSNHYGDVGGGHYTAYAKNHIYNKWFEYDGKIVLLIYFNSIRLLL